MRRERITRLAVWVLALGVLVRLAVWLLLLPDPVKFYTPDSQGYEVRALNLLAQGVFSASEVPPYTPDMVRTPAYPAFVAGVYALTDPAPAAVTLLQCALGGLTAALTMWVATLLGLAAGPAALAGLIVAVDPVSVMTANLLLTETLFTALLVLGIGAVIRSRLAPAAGWAWLTAAAVALALAALVRPIGQWLPVALLPLFGLAGDRQAWRGLLRAGLPFVLGASLLMVPWAYRNDRELGVFALSRMDARVLHHYWAASVLAAARGTSPDAERERLTTDLDARVRGARLSLAEEIALERREALAILRGHPGLTLQMLAKGTGRLLVDPGYSFVCTLLDPAVHEPECFPGRGTMNEPGMLGRAWGRFVTMTTLQQGALVGSALLLAGVYAAAAVGLLALGRARRGLAMWTLALVIGYLIVLSAGAEANSRFRIPILPFLAIAAAAGLDRHRPRSGPP